MKQQIRQIKTLITIIINNEGDNFGTQTLQHQLSELQKAQNIAEKFIWAKDLLQTLNMFEETDKGLIAHTKNNIKELIKELNYEQ